jgi:hypothetical protein
LPPKAARQNKHDFPEDVWLLGLGTPGLQKTHLAKEPLRDPFDITKTHTHRHADKSCSPNQMLVDLANMLRDLAQALLNPATFLLDPTNSPPKAAHGCGLTQTMLDLAILVVDLANFGQI